MKKRRAVSHSQDLRAALARIVQGRATEPDQASLLNAAWSDPVVQLTGERSVTVGGSVSESVFITGNGNLVLTGAFTAPSKMLSVAPGAGYTSLYTRSLTTAIDLLHYLSDADVDVVRSALRSILQMIRTVVAAYYLDRDDLPDKDGLQINANVMVARSIGSRPAEDYPGLRFVDPAVNFQSYRCVLVISEWAHEEHCLPHDFALPVARERGRAMPGAPRTFLTGEIEIVNDIRREAELRGLLEGQPPVVAESIRTYFRERTSFRSFACWRIAFQGEPVGILNVQSNRPDIFGADDLHENDVVGYIRPFCSVLGAVAQTLSDRDDFSHLSSDTGHQS